METSSNASAITIVEKRSGITSRVVPSSAKTSLRTKPSFNRKSNITLSTNTFSASRSNGTIGNQYSSQSVLSVSEKPSFMKKSATNISSKPSFIKRSNTNIRSEGKSRKSSAFSVISKHSEDSTIPTHIFYLYYPELCRRANANPFTGLKSGHYENKRVLSLNADTVKIEEWRHIIKALAADTSLHTISIRSHMTTHPMVEEADTEEKVKHIKKWLVSISTRFVLKGLVEAIRKMLVNTRELTKLELEGLNLQRNYLKEVVLGLCENGTLHHLSFKGSNIGDEGCFMVCNILKTNPTLETLDLSKCKITAQGAECVANLIKIQRVNRYSKMWHQSLRSNDPSLNEMSGLRRISLNHNSRIGNEGLELILRELDDDLWIKALDMQRCNITENIAQKILETIHLNPNLQVLDVRNNQLTDYTIANIYDKLGTKERNSNERSYQWYTSTTTISQMRSENSLPKHLGRNPTQSSNPKPNAPLPYKPNLHENRTAFLRRIANEEQLKKAGGNDLVKIRKEYRDREAYVQRLLKNEIARREKAEQKILILEKNLSNVLSENSSHKILKELMNLKDYLYKYIEANNNNNRNTETSEICCNMTEMLQEINTVSNAINFMLAKQASEFEEAQIDVPNDETQKRCQSLLEELKEKLDNLKNQSKVANNDWKPMKERRHIRDVQSTSCLERYVGRLNSENWSADEAEPIRVVLKMKKKKRSSMSLRK